MNRPLHHSYHTVAIIGGGASGMMAALTAAQVPERRVVLLERQQRIGRKLLATGNGRCNLTNIFAKPQDYYGSDSSFAKPALMLFTPHDTLRFFTNLGLLTTTEADGRVYPLSDSSNSVLDVLRFALTQAGVEQFCGASVDAVIPDEQGFRIEYGGDRLEADAVILACGGAAGSKLGGVMDGYRLGKTLGHKRTSLYPSLTRIVTDSEYPRSLKGIRVQAELRLTRGDILLADGSGEVQFTEKGVSGPAGFNLSRAAATGGPDLILHLSFLPYRRDDLLELLLRRVQTFPSLETSELFTGMLHNRLGRILVKAASLSPSAPLSALSVPQLMQAAAICEDFTLPVSGVEGFEAAQVTAGGLQTAQFDPLSLESRLVPGLFACGELLDIDGPCGGYNLQWAWASGALAGRLGT